MVDIKKIRHKYSMTQVELARRSGVKSQLISMIENGQRTPTLRTAKLLAPCLGVKWTDFFDEKGA